jgi:hypothetical protein
VPYCPWGFLWGPALRTGLVGILWGARTAQIKAFPQSQSVWLRRTLGTCSGRVKWPERCSRDRSRAMQRRSSRAIRTGGSLSQAATRLVIRGLDLPAEVPLNRRSVHDGNPRRLTGLTCTGRPAHRQIRALPPGHLIGRLLDLSHIRWRTCVAHQSTDHTSQAPSQEHADAHEVQSWPF